MWESIVKYQLGKLPLPEPPETYLPKQRELHQIASLTLDENSIAQLAKLPPLHRDPFDRMLIAQSLVEKLPILIADPLFKVYDVEIVWSGA